MSSSLYRTLKNVWTNGLKRSGRQIASMNDTKRGTFVGMDKSGNMFYETDAPEEIHMRTRWVEYKDFWTPDMSQVEPGWHYWLGYGTNTPPNKLQAVAPAGEIHALSVRAYPMPDYVEINRSCTKGAYIPYNTAKPKCNSWVPQVSARQ